MCRRDPCCQSGNRESRYERFLNEEIILLRDFLFFEKRRRHRPRLLIPIPLGTIQTTDED